MSNAKEETYDFFKFMDDTIKREAEKKKLVLDFNTPTPEQQTANRQQLAKFSGNVYERMWLGKRRY